MTEKKWMRLRYMPGTGIGDNGQRVTGSSEHIRISRSAAQEGMVLLKNEENTLPFRKGIKLAVFGKAQADYVKGGGGSGDVTVSYIRGLLDGLREKAAEGKVSLCETLSRFYEQNVEEQRKAGKQPGFTVEPELPDELLKAAAAEADMAVITICRFSSEGWDRTGTPHDGDFYLSEGEEAMVRNVLKAFDRAVVVLNVGSMLDTAWFRNEPKVKAALLGWQAGMEGGLAEADLLCGDACPSGHLVDTFAEKFADYPSSGTFFESESYVTYDEDIYVGYRYFETIPGAAEKVCYPFGFGLSYTSFDITDASAALLEAGDLCFTCRVTNTGAVSGKEVVQVYCEAPRGKLGKPARSLIAFAKTKLLQPGESEILVMTAVPASMASYDDTGLIRKSAWVLEKGDYRFHLGVNVRDTKTLDYVYTVTEDTVTEQLTEKCAPNGLTRRLKSDGTFETVSCGPLKERKPWDAAVLPFDGERPRERDWLPLYREQRKIHQPIPQLDAVAEGRMTLDDFMALLTDEQKIHLLGGQPNRGVSNTFGFGNIPDLGIPNALTADGPAGLRIRPECGVVTTAFPCATLLACTWDPALVEKVGAAGASEVYENGIGVWLTPAINIHRTPLCGRNFEYYSEDPLVAGKMAAAMVRGIQSQGVAASVKHFACNNKETNRRESDSRLSERALREIYLKGFEICVKEADPWTIMSSYNVINGVRASENRELLTDILRGEWGFRGVVTTDWWTHGEQWSEINAGNDIKMGCGMPEHTLIMLREGKLDRDQLDLSVRRLLELLLKLA